MKNKTKRLLCLLLSLAMLVVFAAACKPTEEEKPPEETTSQTPSQTPDSPAPPAPPPEPQTLVVGYSFFSQRFSPFFGKTAYDMDVAAMTQVSLLINDRVGGIILNGIKGETIDYNGTPYFYDNIADIEVVQKADGTVDYNITLREDIKFSDGVPMTIDDVIFNFYVLSDPTYDGSSTFYSLSVTGMTNFRTGVSTEIFEKYEALAYAIMEAGPYNEDFSEWSEELQDALWWNYFMDCGLELVGGILDYCNPYMGTYGPYYADHDVATAMALWGFADWGEEEEDEDIFAGFFTGTVWDIANGEFPTIEEYWVEILEAYGPDPSDDGIGAEISPNSPLSFEEMIASAFISGEGPKDPDAGGEIMTIAGIKKTGDYSCTVTTDEFDATSIYQFGISVAPLHYYGDVNQYDYANNKFGFPKGDLTMVKEKTTVPLGAGPYKFLSYENGVVSYEANENYWKGEPKIKYVRFQETTDADKLAGIISGSFDVTDPSFSDETVKNIKEYNSNGEITGDKVATSTVDNLGYGYIGLASTNVNVGGVPDSVESKYLRMGLATVLAVHRNTVVASYYGDRASVIQYPISNTSWAAPRPTDPGYKQAYSTKLDGSPIYNDSMSESQRYAAAVDAAVEYLAAAGYTWDDAAGVFTAAPAGANMIYEVIIPADGVGDHPAYGILTAAKESLASIGITLEINDPTDSNVLWNALDAGEAELWCAAWGATIDPDMYQVYHSSNVVGAGGTDSNHYQIMDDELDNLIFEARKSADQSFRKATYKRCLEIIMEWAVEVPNYQRQNAIIFSPDRVKLSTLTPDITTFWGWMNDIELLEMNT